MASKYWSEIEKKVTPAIKARVRIAFDISDRIEALMKLKGMSQSDLARALDKQPSEINRWLSGQHNFTTRTLAELEAFFDEPIVIVVGDELYEELLSKNTINWENSTSFIHCGINLEIETGTDFFRMQNSTSENQLPSQSAGNSQFAMAA